MITKQTIDIISINII